MSAAIPKIEEKIKEEISKEDQDWLDALSGNPLEGIDLLVLANALAVRKALVSRRDAIKLDITTTGNNDLDEIRERLQHLNLMSY